MTGEDFLIKCITDEEFERKNIFEFQAHVEISPNKIYHLANQEARKILEANQKLREIDQKRQKEEEEQKAKESVQETPGKSFYGSLAV